MGSSTGLLLYPWPTAMKIIRLATSLAGIFGAASLAHAQPIVEQLDSIEWMTADSSRIARGTVVAVQNIDVPEDYGIWYSVSFQVEETLKGPHPPMLKFVVQTNSIDKSLERWNNEARPLIAFLEKSRCVMAAAGTYGSARYARFEFAPRTGYPKNSFLELDAGEGSNAFSLSLKRITRSEEVLRIVKETAEMPATNEKPCSAWVSVPGHGGLLRLTVPIDTRLESAARRWIASANKEFRREGVIALAYFRSQASRGILEELLADPSVWSYTVTDGSRVAGYQRVYEVREKAYSILTEWGYDVPRPVVREPRSPEAKDE